MWLFWNLSECFMTSFEKIEKKTKIRNEMVKLNLLEDLSLLFLQTGVDKIK